MAGKIKRALLKERMSRINGTINGLAKTYLIICLYVVSYFIRAVQCKTRLTLIFSV